MRGLAIFLCVVLITNPVWGDFKPLTRAEPIVRMVLQEAANEPFDGLVAIAGVAYDRMADNRWPSTEWGVVHQPKQFSGMLLKLRKYSQKQITRARIAAEVARIGERPCGTVLWYHTFKISPPWNKRLDVKCLIGAHLFYGDKK